MLRRAGIALLVLAALVLVAGAAFWAWASSEFTWCYARFESDRDAEAALRDIREAAPGAGVDMAAERRGARVSVTFESGESGRDARAFRRAVRPAVSARGGTLGHPGDGCLERTPFM